MQSECGVSPALELIGDVDILHGRQPRVEALERDSRSSLLISRCSSHLPEDVERDMKRSTPTAPGSTSSSTFPSAVTPTTPVSTPSSAFPSNAQYPAGDKGIPPRSLSLSKFKSRAPHLVGFGGGGALPSGGSGGPPGGGGGSSDNAGQTSSSSTSPTQQAGSQGIGMATAAVGSKGSPGIVNSEQPYTGDGVDMVTGRTLDTPGDAQNDGGLNYRRHLALGTGCGSAASNAGMGQSSGGGQATHAVGSNAGTGQNSGGGPAMYMGSNTQSSGGGQSMFMGSNAGMGYYPEGQSTRQAPYSNSNPTPNYNSFFHGGQSSGHTEVPGHAYYYQRSHSDPRGHGNFPSNVSDPRDLSSLPPSLHPQATLQPDYPIQPTYQPHPQQPVPPTKQAQVPPHVLHPHRHYPYHNPTSIGQSELPTQPHPQYGSGFVNSAWGQSYHMPHSLSSGGGSYVSSHPGGERRNWGNGESSGIQYQQLGSSSSSGDSRLQLLSSSQPSSLNTLSSEAGWESYGPQTMIESMSAATGASSGERCHSFPLTQQVLSYTPYCRIPEEDITGPQGGQQPHPQCHQSRPQYLPHSQQGQPLIRTNQTPPCGEDLAHQLNERLVLTEDTPAGQSEGGAGQQTTTFNAKHTQLTLLDSERLHISEHPQDTVTKLEGKVVFTCKAHVKDPQAKDAKPRLQWYKGEDPLIGEEGSELVFEKVEKRDIGLYYCVVTHPDDDSAKKCSQVAQLSIGEQGSQVPGVPGSGEEKEERDEAPTIIEQPPRRVLAVVGEDLKLQLKVKGEQPLSYKWYRDTEELDYCKTAELVIPRATYGDSGQYCCSISNHHGSQLSNSFHVQVTKVKGESLRSNEGKKQRPTSLYNWEGQNISDSFLKEVSWAISRQIVNWQKLVSYLGLNYSDFLEVRVQGSGMIIEEQCLQLLRRWRERNREGRSHLKMRLVRAGVDFDALLNSIPGGQVKGVEHMIVEKPYITSHPQSLQVIYGQEFSLSVGVSSGPGHCTFQWYHNHLPLHGKTQPRLLIKSAVDSDAGEYYCVVANKGGASDSEIAFVKILNPHSSVSVPAAALPTLEGRHRGMSMPGWSGPASGGVESVRNGLSSSLAQSKMGVIGPSLSAALPPSLAAHPTRPGEDLIGRGYQLTENQPVGWGGGTEGVVGRGGVLASGSRRGSGSAVLPTGEKPRIIEHPQSQIVDTGGPLTLHCKALPSQGEQLNYLWYFNGLSLQQEVRPEYFINCFTDEDEGIYFCKVSNFWGEVDSNMAHVQMKDDD